MPVTQRTLRLQDELATQLAAVTDAQTRTLTSAWVTAWDEVAADLQAELVLMVADGSRVTASRLIRSRRLQSVLLSIADHLTTLAKNAKITIASDLVDVVRTAAAAQKALVDSQLPAGPHGLVDLTATPTDRALEAIVRRSTEQITARTLPIPAETHDVVRCELVRGIAAGTNPRETAARIVKRTEGGFNGGLTRALVIARTETLDAHRQAAAAGQAEHADVLGGWVWLAKLDTKTCRSCWAQAGQLHPLDEAGPHDHQQGRCARMPKTQSWAELGFDLEEPADHLPDAETEFAGLTVEQQKAILGLRGYAAWVRGEFPMSAWSQKRTTKGWRDSYGTAPAPKTQSGGRRASAA